MNKKLSKGIKISIPLLLGVLLIWYSVSTSSADELQSIWQKIKEANYYWISLSVIMGVIAHLSRAIRWKLLLAPLKCRPPLYNSFFSVMVGYLSNLGIPRSGELLRGATLASYEDLEFDSTFGTIVTERIIDMLCLLLIIGFTMTLQAPVIIEFFSARNINLSLSISILIAGIVLTYITYHLIKNSKNKWIKKISAFLKGLLNGMKSITQIKDKGKFVFHTLLIWSMYIGIFWVTKYSITETAELGLGEILVAFIVGSFSISITSGGLGVYPLAIATVLHIYGIDKASGEALGWILWTAQTAIMLFLGLISIILLPIMNRKKIFN